MRTLVALGLVVGFAVPAPAAVPPNRINYQGVLRDAAGAPGNGTFDMIFRLYDQASGGAEVLQDRHLVVDGTGVTVSDGLFSVEIGSGQVLDGGGPGSYATLAEAFRDYGSLWLAIQIGAETLAPRLSLASAGYALNARYCAGKDPFEFLDTGADTQTKSGQLNLSGTSAPPGQAPLVTNGTIGARIESTSGSLVELGRYSDGLWATSGPGPGSAGVFYSYGGTAVNALGSYTGGYFQDLDHPSWAYLANGDYGARIQGPLTGAYVQTPGADSWVRLAEPGYGLRAKAMGTLAPDVITAGGWYELRHPGGATNMATAAVAARLPIDFGVFWGYIDTVVGFWGEGEIGAVFHSNTNQSSAWLAQWDIGIVAIGDTTGGRFDTWASNAWAEVAGPTYKIDGVGSVAFVQNHPIEKDRVIVYNAPEGDEVATYTRGSARLAGGVARVALGETFAWVTNPDLGLTAHLTPRGAPVALAVAGLTTKELVVRAPAGAPPDLEFDYLVYGLRIGFEETSIVQEKRREAYIPSMASHRKRYEEHPELRRFSALERTKQMRREMGHEAAADLSASTSLREAIHEFDPAVDRPDVGPARGDRPPGGTAADPPRPTLSRAAASSAATGGANAAGDDAGLPAGEPRGPLAVAPDPIRRPPMAETLRVSEPVRAGDLLALDPSDPERVRRPAGAADPLVVGVAAADSAGDLVALATTRIVRVWADASTGAIAAGDLLVSAPLPGYAMRATEGASGTVFGKALEPLEAGTGEIRALWMPR